jgi:hypothetical protein
VFDAKLKKIAKAKPASGGQARSVMHATAKKK